MYYYKSSMVMGKGYKYILPDAQTTLFKNLKFALLFQNTEYNLNFQVKNNITLIIAARVIVKL